MEFGADGEFILGCYGDMPFLGRVCGFGGFGLTDVWRSVWGWHNIGLVRGGGLLVGWDGWKFCVLGLG